MQWGAGGVWIVGSGEGGRRNLLLLTRWMRKPVILGALGETSLEGMKNEVQKKKETAGVTAGVCLEPNLD